MLKAYSRRSIVCICAFIIKWHSENRSCFKLLNLVENENQDGRFDRQMYPATCADCNAATEVPFQPSGDRPVYCRDCYNKRKDSRPRRDFRR